MLLAAALARPLGAPVALGSGGLIYGTCLLPFVAAAILSTDTLLTFWETLAMFAFVRFWWRPGGERGAAGCCDVGGLGARLHDQGTAGTAPARWRLPFAWLACSRGDRRGSCSGGRRCCSSLVIALWWFLAVVATRPELLGYFLGYEVVDRVFTDVHGRNGQWYGALIAVYLPVFLLGALPWTRALLRGLRSPAAAAPRGYLATSMRTA